MIFNIIKQNFKKDIEVAYAGDICATFGIDCSTGDTFVTEKDFKLSMESMYVPDPVVSLSIKPIDSSMNDHFSKGINRLFFLKKILYFLYFKINNKKIYERRSNI